MKGLSEEGGLFIPEKLKKFDYKELKELSNSITEILHFIL